MTSERFDEQMEILDENNPEAILYDSSSPQSTSTSSLTWISWFCSLPGHEYFAEVAEDFIEDEFNLTGLAGIVGFYKEALEMILDVEPEESLKIPDVSIVEHSAEMLYGLIHARFILTRFGLQQMVEKYENGHFGFCPRFCCQSCPVVPCGRSDTPGVDTVKLYCPNCMDLYVPPSSRFQGVDGSFFGTTFPHLLFHTYKDLQPSMLAPPSDDQQFQQQYQQNVANDQYKPAAPKLYVPKIYGFKISERSRSGPRMQWLRMRPQSVDELNSVDNKGRFKHLNIDQPLPVRPTKAPNPSKESKLFDDEDEEVINSESDDDENANANNNNANQTSNQIQS